MEYLLTFDSNCPACSAVARTVAEMECDRLHVKALTDPDVVAHLVRAGWQDPAEPVLIMLTDDDEPRVFRGRAMRLRLARLVGMRRARDLVRLAWMEQEARRSRRGISRRKLLGTGIVGLGAGLLPGAASADTPNESAGSLHQVRTTEADRVMRLPQVRQAAHAWGAVVAGAVHSYGTGEDQVLIIEHEGTSTISLLDATPTSTSPLYGLQQRSSGFRMLDQADGPMFDIRIDDKCMLIEPISRKSIPTLSLPTSSPVSRFA